VEEDDEGEDQDDPGDAVVPVVKHFALLLSEGSLHPMQSRPKGAEQHLRAKRRDADIFLPIREN
jgi:hypothetical protein